MEFVAIVTVLLLLQVFFFSYQVGVERVKHGIHAPATVGNPEFERAFRVHQNTVEQLVIFIPALWLFAQYVRADVAAGLGVVFLVARFIYRGAYMQDPQKRSAGFGIGALAMAVLMLGGLVGAVMDLI